MGYMKRRERGKEEKRKEKILFFTKLLSFTVSTFYNKYFIIFSTILNFNFYIKMFNSNILKSFNMIDKKGYKLVNNDFMSFSCILNWNEGNKRMR